MGEKKGVAPFCAGLPLIKRSRWTGRTGREGGRVQFIAQYPCGTCPLTWLCDDSITLRRACTNTKQRIKNANGSLCLHLCGALARTSRLIFESISFHFTVSMCARLGLDACNGNHRLSDIMHARKKYQPPTFIYYILFPFQFSEQ